MTPPAAGRRLKHPNRTWVRPFREGAGPLYLQIAQQVREAVVLVEPPLSENTLHIMVSLKHPEHQQIVERFERSIAAMKADGSYQRLLRQHGF